ncbi:MAG TPA: sulfurtransferase [Gemmataceae bacterium]|nr:sulfurtransferase [Gemmataceae bacterium]
MVFQILCLLSFVGVSSADKPAGYPRKDLLVEASALARPDLAERYRILDCRSKQKYLAGHIPSAACVDLADWSKAFGLGQDTAGWAKRLGALGIGIDTSVVVYDDTASKDAARIWWILRYWGVKDVRLLNGGWPAWKSSGSKVATEESTYSSPMPILHPQHDRLATKNQVLDSLKNKSFQIIDARTTGEFCGTEKTAKRNGAIPGAIHLEWIELLDKYSQRFKNAEELSKIFRESGIDLANPSVTHCQSGGRAAVMAFALELMGAKEVRNYYRSWAEWGNADDTPIVKPKN